MLLRTRIALVSTAATLLGLCLLTVWAKAPAPTKIGKPEPFTNSVGMKLVPIPAGKFMMGSPSGEVDRCADEGRHEVEITTPFYLGAFEVTQAQYRSVTGKNPSYFSLTADWTGSRGKGGPIKNTDDFPVDRVSWHDAVAFCAKLSDTPAEKRAGRKYRLPTEAEWEFACRGGSRAYQKYHTGDTLSGSQANVDAMNGKHGSRRIEDYLLRTTHVGSYKPNGFGLYDMHGNVREWCSDWYGETYYDGSPKKAPTGPAKGRLRVLRGGDWCAVQESCRTAKRGGWEPDEQGTGEGFRVACRQ